jgi:hypothetical protein
MNVAGKRPRSEAFIMGTGDGRWRMWRLSETWRRTKRNSLRLVGRRRQFHLVLRHYLEAGAPEIDDYYPAFPAERYCICS